MNTEIALRYTYKLYYAVFTSGSEVKNKLDMIHQLNLIAEHKMT